MLLELLLFDGNEPTYGNVNKRHVSGCFHAYALTG